MPRTATSLLVAVGVVASSALLACAVDLDPGEDAPAESGASSAIVNGEATTAFPTTGVLLGEADNLVCSGTLIGCDRFLTAAHCVCLGDGPDCQSEAPAEPLRVYLQNAGFFSVVARHVHPAFAFPDNDVAVLELDRSVAGLRPSPLPTAAAELGQAGVIVGFGRSGGYEQDYGIKQHGSVVTDECPENAAGPGHVCWEFQGDGANTCNGDSGGPLFLETADGDLAVAGITSGGTRGDCLIGDHSYDNAVFSFVDYIIDAAGGPTSLGQETCGDLPLLGQPGAAVASQQGLLDPGQSATFEIEVPAGTAELRVSLNATEGSNPNLFIRAGETATAMTSDCADDGPSSYGFCDVLSPLPGIWHVLVQGIGAGEYQLTTTMLAGAPVATDDAYAVRAGKSLEVTPEDGVLANDAQVGRGPLAAEIVSPPLLGTIDLRPDGSFIYTPGTSRAGTDAFTYRARDEAYAGAATVSFTVAAQPPPHDDRAGDEESDDTGCAAGAPGTSGLAWLLAAVLAMLGRASRRRRSPTRSSRGVPTTQTVPGASRSRRTSS